MKKSVLIKIGVVTVLTLIATLQAHAECSRVLFEQTYDVTSSLRDEHPNTQFHIDPTLQSDYGVRLNMLPDNGTITDPFGKQHPTGGGYRYEVFKDGQMIYATPVTPDSVMDLTGLRHHLSQYLSQLGCH